MLPELLLAQKKKDVQVWLLNLVMPILKLFLTISMKIWMKVNGVIKDGIITSILDYTG